MKHRVRVNIDKKTISFILNENSYTMKLFEFEEFLRDCDGYSGIRLTKHYHFLTYDELVTQGLPQYISKILRRQFGNYFMEQPGVVDIIERITNKIKNGGYGKRNIHKYMRPQPQKIEIIDEYIN